jgi:DNA-binding LytR/AlgR family response regulator
MIKCLTVDDEPLALDVIENYVSKVSNLHLAGRCSSAEDALEILNKNDIDLIFLDIQMPGVSGIQFLKSLKNPPMIIFTTAYENYALEGYDLDIVDYLLKPIPFERFIKAVDKAKEMYSLQKIKINSPAQPMDFIFVRSEYQTIKINLNDILYIEGLKDYVKIFCGPKPILTHYNLKGIKEKLPADNFLRIHKSYIIPIKKIESVQKNIVRVGGNEIPLGETYKDQLYKIVHKNDK